MIARVADAVSQILELGRFPLMLGGEHSISLGAVQAFAQSEKEFSVLHLDAHADLRDEFEGTKYSHTCVMRRIRELVPAVSVGVRSLSKEEAQSIKRNKWPVFGTKFDEEKIISQLEKDKVYLTIDVDVFDPAIMPATGMPEPGGLDWEQLLSLLRAVSKKRKIIGLDIVELNPLLTSSPAPAFTSAKLAYGLLGYVLCRK